MLRCPEIEVTGSGFPRVEKCGKFVECACDRANSEAPRVGHRRLCGYLHSNTALVMSQYRSFFRSMSRDEL